MSSIHGIQSVDSPTLHAPDPLTPLTKPGSKPNPLDIAEILHLVGEYILSWQTLTQCLLVSRSWYATLLPLLWIDIKMSLKKDSPPVQMVEKHALLIRKIAFAYDREVHTVSFTFILPSLSDATFYDRYDFTAGFIHQHCQTLTNITLRNLNVDNLKSIQDAMAECKGLQRLHISHMCLKSSRHWMSLYEKLWSQVKVLSLGGSWYSNNDMDDDYEIGLNYVPATEEEKTLLAARAGPCKIRSLTIDSDESSVMVLQDQLWMIKQCQELVHLDWVVYASYDVRNHDYRPLRLLVQEVQSGRAKLDKLESLRCVNQALRWQDLAVLIDAMPRVTALNFSEGASFDEGSWRVLQRCPRILSTLTILQLRGHWHFREEAVHDLMCTMPNLEEFSAVWISDTAILDGRPWICTKLRKLELFFVITTPSLQLKVLSRISALVRLERLDMKENYYREFMPGQELRLTLKEGLGLLKPLHRLRSLIGPRCKTNGVTYGVVWEEAEVDWILKNWPQMRTLLHYDVSQQLGDRLKDAMGEYLFCDNE